MSLSTVLVGEFWADDGDCDEPDGDRPDERVAGSGCKQDQSNGSRDADEPWSASGVPTGQGLRSAGPGGVGFPEARPAEQSRLPGDLRDMATGIIRERYPDFGPTLAAEKLAELHDIHLARETVRQWMITAGVWEELPAPRQAGYQPPHPCAVLVRARHVRRCDVLRSTPPTPHITHRHS